MMKNKFSCRILTGEVYFHRWDLTFNSLITLLDHTTAEGGEIDWCTTCSSLSPSSLKDS